MKTIHTGSEVLDEVFKGYEKDVVSTIYGPAGSGKTLLCLLAVIDVARSGKKVIFIDTEGGFSVERVKQLCEDYEKILENILFLKPVSFEEQKNCFEKLRNLVNEKIGLIVVDTVAMLYRLEMGKSDDVYGVNKELGQQISFLTEIARNKEIPVLLTNQVYADFDNRERVNMVGGDILKYGSKCLIELQCYKNCRRAILRKHRSIEEGKLVDFNIVEKGIEGVE